MSGNRGHVPKADWYSGVYATLPVNMTVHTDEPTASRPIGVLDASGRPIHKAQERRVVGFVDFDRVRS